MASSTQYLISNWRNIKDIERKYVLTWIVFGLAICFTEIGGRLEFFHKRWVIFPHLIALIVLAFTSISAWIAIKGKSNYLFKEVPISKEQFTKVVGVNSQSVLYILMLGTIYKHLLGWAPIWTLLCLTVIWLSIYFVGMLRFLTEISTNTSTNGLIGQIGTKNEKFLDFLIIGFCLIMVIIAFAAYHNLHLK